MKLIPIEEKDLDIFYKHLENDFIFEERRNKEDYLQTIKNKHFKPNFIYDKQLKQVVGYFCYWDFKDFIFGEHFAIFENLRNKGLGSKFLKFYLSKLKKPFIGEIEIPDNEISIRRRNYYLNKNFKILKTDYTQPSYHNSNEGVSMYIIGFDKSKQFDFEANLNKMLNIVSKNVYNINV